MASVKRENTVWGWERISAAWVGVPRKVKEFYIAWRVVTLNVAHVMALHMLALH